jgi:hypothetical protein
MNTAIAAMLLRSITRSYLNLERWRLGSTGTALGTRAHRLARSLSPRYLLMPL